MVRRNWIGIRTAESPENSMQLKYEQRTHRELLEIKLWMTGDRCKQHSMNGASKKQKENSETSQA